MNAYIFAGNVRHRQLFIVVGIRCRFFCVDRFELTGLFRKRDLNPKLRRWAHRVTEYGKVLLWQARIKWQAERENIVPVAFSRMLFQILQEHFGIIDLFPDDPI